MELIIHVTVITDVAVITIPKDVTFLSFTLAFASNAAGNCVCKSTSDDSCWYHRSTR